MYCCFGCLSLGEQQKQLATSPETQSGWKLDGLGVRLGIGLIVVAQSMIFGLALNLHDDVSESVRWVAQSLILCATVLVIATLGPPLFRAAWHELRRGRLTIEALFILTMSGAMTASLQAFITGHGKIYFEVVSVLLVVYTLGKVIGSRSRAAALAGARAWAGQLETCRLVDAAGRTRVVPVREVQVGDVVEVNPGETFAVDGVIVAGAGFVSEAAVNGEPFAAVRRSGDRVLAGAASVDAAFRIEATTRGTERQVDQLLAVVESASDRPLSLQAQADALGRWFFPLVVLTACGTFGYWTFFTAEGWEAGLFNAMSVLLVACPCVIGLATPIVIWAALSRLAERGVIVRRGDAVERLAEVDCVMLDKTGTLTDDSFALLDIATIVEGDERAKLLGWLSIVQERSNHPVARPFAKLPRVFADGEEPRVSSLNVVPGCGVIAEIEANGTKHTLHIGTPNWIAENSNESQLFLPSPARGEGGCEFASNRVRGGYENSTPHPAELTFCDPLPQGERGRNAGRPGLFGESLVSQLRANGHRVDVALDDELVAVTVLAEQLRDSAPQALAHFRELGLPVEVLTGDMTERAATLNLPARSGLLPLDKQRAVEEAKGAGQHPLFVGDGINDAAALATAHVGIALASGTDIANSAADVTLYHNDLRVVPWAVELSREAVRAVRRNMYCALCYNLVGITLAACGVLHPVVAVVLMLVSSLSLIFASTRVGVSVCGCSDSSGMSGIGDRGSADEATPQAMANPARAIIHGTAFSLQGACFLLLLASVREWPVALGILGAFAIVGTLLAYLWHRWSTIPHSVDMCFGMLTLGNLGMLLGWWADAGFTALHDRGCCACVESMRDGLLTSPWMWVGMLAFANVAMLWLPRRSGSHGGSHGLAMFTGGNLGMVVGMIAGGWCAACVETASVSLAVVLGFAGMTVGMLAGMLLGTWSTERLLNAVRSMSRSWRWSRTSTLASSSSTSR